MLPRIEAPEDYEPLDGVLISHLHLDHLDMPSMRRLERTVPVVVPRGGGAILRRIGFTDVREVVAGESVRIAGVEVPAVPAAHDSRRRPGGAEADPLGYVAGGAARVYFAGDTDVFDGMSELGALDLALLPVCAVPWAATTAAVGGLAVACVAAGLLPAWAPMALSGALAVAIPLSIMHGLLRLVRDAGATLQAVAGALTVYLLIGFVVHLSDAPYFASGTDATEGERVYYSLAVMTTTGFGDLTAGQPLGRALAVVEMLVGQLYLETVIGSLAQRRPT